MQRERTTVTLKGAHAAKNDRFEMWKFDDGVCSIEAPVGESFMIVSWMQRFFGPENVEVTRELVSDGRSADHAPEPVEARESEVPEDGTASDEEADDWGADDAAEEGPPGDFPAGSEDDGAETEGLIF